MLVEQEAYDLFTSSCHILGYVDLVLKNNVSLFFPLLICNYNYVLDFARISMNTEFARYHNDYKMVKIFV